LNADRLAVVDHREDAGHVLDEVAFLVGELLGGEGELVEVLLVHEVIVRSVFVEVLDGSAGEVGVADEVGAFENSVYFRAGLQVSRPYFVQRAGAAGGGRLHLNLLDHARGAVEFHDQSVFQILGYRHAGPFEK
jgi:hypothetical protein